MPHAPRTVTTTSKGAALLATVLACATPARAQDAEARRLFEEGVALREAGDTEGAVARLRRAHALEPDARTAYNLAAALFDQGRLVEAERLLRRVIARGEDLLVADAARALQGEIAPRIATLGLTVAGAELDQRVFVDGAATGLGIEGAREIRLDPGRHRVEVRDASGVVLARRDVELGEGERASLALHPVAPPSVRATSEPRAHGRSAVGASAPAANDGGSSDETWAWVGVGAGLAVVIVVGAVATGLALGGQSGGAPPVASLPPVIVRGRDG